MEYFVHYLPYFNIISLCCCRMTVSFAFPLFLWFTIPISDLITSLVLAADICLIATVPDFHKAEFQL